jgi:hypothetical protein
MGRGQKTRAGDWQSTMPLIITTRPPVRVFAYTEGYMMTLQERSLGNIDYFPRAALSLGPDWKGHLVVFILEAD